MASVGLAIPTAAPDVQPNTAVEFARRAEAAGAGSVWVMDRLVFSNYDPLVTLGALTAVTNRVRLGTCVLLATLRPPALLAKMLGSLDRMSGGRLVVGIGVGSRPDDFAAAGTPWEHRGGRAEELVQILRLAWSGQPVRFAGTHYRIDVGPIGPTPAQAHIPIWFGGSAESAMRRIARIGDGYIGSSSGGPAGFRERWQQIQRYAEKTGRDPASITPAALVYACVDDDRSRAEELARAYFSHYYGPGRREITGYMLGPADDCVRVAESYFEAGVDTLIVGSVTADIRYFERLCADVLPRLGGR
ncbi:MAG TPA: LLM class flavin-dependent oxidoreductase [Gemmatimonadales bacterium]|nr:LLM class flavin-dependent oxidoreductase [Gemmatimonadales bacterium]